MDRCVLFQIMSNQLNLPQANSKHLKDDQEKWEAPELNFSNVIAKGQNIYVNVPVSGKNPVFSLSLSGIECRLMREKIKLTWGWNIIFFWPLVPLHPGSARKREPVTTRAWQRRPWKWKGCAGCAMFPLLGLVLRFARGRVTRVGVSGGGENTGDCMRWSPLFLSTANRPYQHRRRTAVCDDGGRPGSVTGNGRLGGSGLRQGLMWERGQGACQSSEGTLRCGGSCSLKVTDVGRTFWDRQVVGSVPLTSRKTVVGESEQIVLSSLST